MASDDVRIKEDVLALAVERKIRPLVEQGAFEDPDEEGYHHSKVLPTAGPFLTQEAIRSDARESLLKATQASSNLLATQEKIWTKQLTKHCDPEECKRHLLDLLYGSGEPIDRVRSFYDWAAVRPVPDTDYKQGCTNTVISYLLAMVDPAEYAFCKPTVYKAAALALLGRDAVVRDKVRRVVHATAFYKEALRLLKETHGLPFTDLLYIHAAFYRMIPKHNPDSGNWENLKGEPPPPPPPPPPPTPGNLDSILSDEVGELLLERKNVVLYGPPGTGKTFKALDLVRRWRGCQGETSVDQVTFHPSYAYEDFIEGFRPVDGGGFELREGILVKLVRKAQGDADRQYLLIIDEINRGDVARLFGELITLVEADKRKPEAARMLPYSQSDFWLPPNLHILGTMNTADRSISLMDIAIRRRFSFVEFLPDPDVLTAGGAYLREIRELSLADLMQGINRRLLDAGVDRDRAIGHSYFLIPKDADKPLDALYTRLRFDVFPLVEEYCYADRGMIQRILGGLVNERGEINAELADDEQELLAVLTKLATFDE